MRDDGFSPLRSRLTCTATGLRARLPSLARPAFLAAALLVASDACADICKYIDAEGNTHYSNVAPEKGWRKLACTSGDDSTVRRSGSNGAASRAAPSPQGFPRVDPDTQKGRDDVRRKVLNDELAAEEKLLAESRAAYADGGPVPLPEERQDAEKYRARIARLRQSVTLHEKNIEALKKELAGVK
jgi:hypothetical protein